MQHLGLPAALNQESGQVIEQFRMAWTLSVGSKVICGRYNPSPKMIEPNTIGKNSSGERMAWTT